MSWGTSCEADDYGCTLKELMRARRLASMTGNLIGRETLAGGGAAEAGDRVLGLPLTATVARLPRRDCVR